MTSSKIRILFVITKSNMGGAQRYVYELATHLSKDTYEVAVAFGGHGILKQKLEEKGIQTFEIKSFERDINFGKEIRSLFELNKIIQLFNPHILHLNSSKAGGSGALLGRVTGVPRIIFTAHGWPFYEKRNIVWRGLVWFFSYLTTLLSHSVIVVSAHDCDKHMMPFQSRKLVHINTAVPPIDFKERDIARAELFSDDDQRINHDAVWAVSTGELTQNKNLMWLLESLKKTNESSKQKIFLTLLGEGEDREKLETFVKKHGMEDQVLFLGYQESARTYLRAFDVFILPSLKEGLPYGLLEAGAAGLYCIASRVGGIPEIINNDIDGVLIDPSDEKSLVTALTSIPYDVETLGQKLQKKIAADFSLTDMVERTELLYKQKPIQ